MVHIDTEIYRSAHSSFVTLFPANGITIKVLADGMTDQEEQERELIVFT
jgi:hypothetical protein